MEEGRSQKEKSISVKVQAAVEARRKGSEDPGAVSAAEIEEARDRAARGQAIFHGTVFDADGRPCSDAEIWYDGHLAGTSDERGRYRVDVRIAPVTWDGFLPGFPPLIAHQSGAGSSEVFAPPRSQRLDLHLSPEHRVTGIVRDRPGNPISPAKIVCRVTSQRHLFTESIQVSGDGRFELRGVPRNCNVHFWVSSASHSTRQWVRLYVSQDVEGFPIEVLSAWRVSGRFQPWPYPAADVQARLFVAAEGSEEQAHAVEEDGSFDVPAAAGFAWLSLRTEPAEFWSKEVKEGGSLGTIALPATSAIRGRVALPAGLGEELDLRISVAARNPYRVASCPIRSSGKFESASVPCGLARLALMLAPDFVSDVPLTEVVLRPGKLLELDEVRPSGFVVIGRCVDAGGSKVDRRIAVELSSKKGDRSCLEHSTLTGAEGEFLLTMNSATDDISDPAHALLTVRDVGFHLPFSIDLGPIASDRFLFREIVLPEGQILRGQLEEGGENLCGWWVVAFPLRLVEGVIRGAGPAPPADGLGRQLESAAGGEFLTDVTAGDGSFELKGLSAEPYALWVESPEPQDPACESTVVLFPDVVPGNERLILSLSGLRSQ